RNEKNVNCQEATIDTQQSPDFSHEIFPFEYKTTPLFHLWKGELKYHQDGVNPNPKAGP
ncbi:hypothetical protein ACJX0J_025614, partial [Zea mays]